jgi:methanol---5-hydroxybenzimidazolylcobamide Co-methyltransferase
MTTTTTGARRIFSELAIANPDDLLFGVCPNPVRLTEAITVGNGTAIPELNYILPHGSEVSEEAMDQVVAVYRTMAEKALQRAVDLGIPALVIEIELVFELTLYPEWGARVIRATREVIDRFEPLGVHAALRTTVADIRDRVRPPRNRTSAETELMFESFERCAPYSDILSIETTGGKEVSDDAVLQCDMGGILFALGELASRDMGFVWDRVVAIAAAHGKVAGGDAACGFANTAMQLARKRMIPGVFAAVVRAAGAARSLVALECGATGPDKDCAYEGPILKAIAGIPISMEGKSAACAHSSPVGNVAMCCCDLWSNESIPYVNLFGGHSPEVSLEQLWYDCKLLNTATRTGQARALRDMLSESDIHTSAEALVLAPASCVRIAKAIVDGRDYSARCTNAAREALDIVEEAHRRGALTIPEMEQPWLELIRQSIDAYADLGGDTLGTFLPAYGEKFIPAEYGLD